MQKTEKLSAFSIRLKSIRLRKGWSQADMAKFVGVSTGLIGNWEAETNFPSNKSLGKLAEKLSVSVGYLLGEDGYPETSETNKPMIANSQVANVRIEKPSKAQIKQIPVVSWATAGHGGNFSDLAGMIDEWVECDCADPNAYALIVDGDSMGPQFQPGDRIVLMPNSEPRNGDLVVARVESTGDVYFKLFHQTGPGGKTVRLTSFNPLYPALEFPQKAFRFIHPMHSMFRRWRR